jgi:hypothetical protein
LGSITDLVVELDDRRSGSVRDALARLLGDLNLEIGFRTGAGTYLTPEGVPINLPEEGSGRIATIVERL